MAGSLFAIEVEVTNGKSASLTSRREKINIPAKVAAIEYDPNRTARLALLNYADGEKRYIVAPVGLRVGDTVLSGPDAEVAPGNTLPLSKIPTGTRIHNIELKTGRWWTIGPFSWYFCQIDRKRRKIWTGTFTFRRNSTDPSEIAWQLLVRLAMLITVISN